MASRLNVAPAVVTIGEAVYRRARVVVRDNKATLWGQTSDPILGPVPITAVERGRPGWRVVAVEGPPWDVQRDPDCGCGGRRRPIRTGGPEVA